MTEKTIFSKIIEGEIPCNKIYEDELFFAFLDIMPATLGHTLVIPKKKFKDISELEGDYLTQYLPTIQKIAQAIVDVIPAQQYKIINNKGAKAGQSVFHVHFHIIPIDEISSFQPENVGWKGQKKLHDGKAGRQLAKKIKTALKI